MRKNPYPGFGSEHSWAIAGKVFATLAAINALVALVGIGVVGSHMNISDVDPYKAK